MRVRIPSRAIMVSLLTISAACRGGAPGRGGIAVPAGPEEAALDLFRLALLDRPTDAELLQVIEASTPRPEMATLRVALDGLRRTSSPRVVSAEILPGVGRAAIELEAIQAEGGTARYSAQLARRSDGMWRVVWFQGPGGAWPPGRGAPGEGLSTSAPR